jgi:hypothetical protein
MSADTSSLSASSLSTPSRALPEHDIRMSDAMVGNRICRKAVTTQRQKGGIRVSAIKPYSTRNTLFLFGGEGEIRTHEGREALPVFKTGAFNRSATSPTL